jgi:RNA polymerase-binding transcription factor
MDRRDLQRYKRLLLAKVDELSRTQSVAASPAPGAGDPQGDVVDQANADAEAELHIRLHQSDADVLRAIEDALARITQDRFGVCEVCSSPISKSRLEALPWARLCRDCKERDPSAT